MAVGDFFAHNPQICDYPQFLSEEFYILDTIFLQFSLIFQKISRKQAYQNWILYKKETGPCSLAGSLFIRSLLHSLLW